MTLRWSRPILTIALASALLIGGSGAAGAQVLKKMVTVAEVEIPWSSPGPIVWCDGQLFCLDGKTKTVFRVDREGTAEEAFTLGPEVGSPADLTFIGGHLWVSDRTSGDLDKYTLSGKWLRSLKTPKPEPMGIAFDGTRVWIGTADRLLVKSAMAGSDLNVLERFQKKQTVFHVLTWAGSVLWGCRAGRGEVCTVNPGNGKITLRYSSPVPDPVGIAWDGKFIWLVDGETGKIHKVTPPEGP